MLALGSPESLPRLPVATLTDLIFPNTSPPEVVVAPSHKLFAKIVKRLEEVFEDLRYQRISEVDASIETNHIFGSNKRNNCNTPSPIQQESHFR